MWQIFLDLGEWAGAIAVFITLVYLARQVGVNANQLEKQVQTDLDEIIFSAYDPIYEGRNSEIMVTGLQRPDELSEADAYVFNLLMYRHLHVILLAGERALAGDVSQDMGSRLGEHYREVLVETPGGKAWLQAHKAEQWREPLEALGLADALDWSA